MSMVSHIARAHTVTTSSDHMAAVLRNIAFSYDGGTTWALDDVDLTVRLGERICLIGRNGSGKSTLARLIAGLTAPDAGDITLLDQHVFDGQSNTPNPANYRTARHNIGAVFQNPEDQIVTTVVEDDVAFGPENLGIAHDKIGERIATSLNAVDMAAQRRNDPTHMSGGQQQRIAIAGMLAMNPAMLVLDEPTAMLDPVARGEVMHILDILQSRGTTIVHVTHHLDETVHADRIIELDHGRVVRVQTGNVTSHATSSSTISEYAIDSSAVSVSTNNKSNGDQARVRNDSVSSILHQRNDLEHTHFEHTEHTEHTDYTEHTEHTTFEHHITTGIGTTNIGRKSPIITVDHVSYRYPDAQAPAIEDLSLTIREGEIVAIMGGNGAGKSTLARLLCALDRPNRGSITVAGVPVATARTGLFHKRPKTSRTLKRRQREILRRNVGFVMQHPERQLFADTVAEDVAYGPRNQGLSEDEVHQRVDQALKLLHIDQLANRSPFSLSGGQQRLAAIAGVIACQPHVLIMDEPTASLDTQAAECIHALVRKLQQQGVTIVMITHSFEESHALANRIITMTTPASHTPADAANTDIADVDTMNVSASANTATTLPLNSHDTATSGPNHTAYAADTANSAAKEATDSTNRYSFIASMDPRVKMATFLTLMFTAFAISTPAQLALSALLVAGIVTAARLNPLRLLAHVHMFLIVFLIMGLCNVFFVHSGEILAHLGPIAITTDGVTTAMLYTCRFALVILLGAVFLATTTPTATTDAFGSLLSPLSHLGVHTQEIALVLSLALRFLPTLGAEAKAIVDAQAARGGSVETGSLIRRIHATAAVIVPVFAAALRHADNLSLALDARCYEEGRRRTHWRVMQVRRRDYAFIALCAIYLVMLAAAGFVA